MASLSIHNAILVTATGESPGGVLVGDDGTIEAVLDGDGAAASFRTPAALTLCAGTIYVLDSHTVRAIDANV